MCKAHPEAVSLSELVSFYRKSALLMAVSLDQRDVTGGLQVLMEGLAVAGKPVLSGEAAKAALPAIKAQMIRRLDRSKYVGKGQDKALSLEVCRMADNLICASLLMSPNADGYMHMCLFAYLLEAAEDADSGEYMLWVYSSARVFLRTVPSSVHRLYRIRLPEIYAHFAEVESQRWVKQLYVTPPLCQYSINGRT